MKRFFLTLAILTYTTTSSAAHESLLDQSYQHQSPHNTAHIQTQTSSNSIHSTPALADATLAIPDTRTRLRHSKHIRDQEVTIVTMITGFISSGIAFGSLGYLIALRIFAS